MVESENDARFERGASEQMVSDLGESIRREFANLAVSYKSAAGC
jgi:hypothetical protein